MSSKKFRLGLWLGDPRQPLSLMRGVGPFSAMAKADDGLELVYPPVLPQGGMDVGWSWLAHCDGLFYSHPDTEQDVSVLWLARAMGLPIWIEYVDDVFNVEVTNPVYQSVKNRRSLREAVTQAIGFADVISYVSEPCREAFPKAPDSARVEVIQEACLWPAWELPRRRMVTWRGLGSHDADVDTVLDALCRVARDYPDWEWGLLGEPAEEMTARLSEAAGHGADGKSRVKVAPYFSTPFHAIQAWGGTAPYLHLVPLANTAFNRAKSHLAWLEASAVGAAVIAPGYLEEWQQPGVMHYDAVILEGPGLATFELVLRRQLDGYLEGALHPGCVAARQAIYPMRTLAMMNRKRWACVQELIDRRKGKKGT